MTHDRHLYRERTPWPGWVYAVLWGPVLLSCYPLLAGWGTDEDFGTRLAVVIGIIGFVGVLIWLMSGLTVTLYGDRMVVSLGLANVVKKTIRYSEIEYLESVRYHPIREFGGWGLRGSGKKKAWTARGDQAVVVGLANETRLYVGSDHPQRLEMRIRTAAGDVLTDK